MPQASRVGSSFIPQPLPADQPQEVRNLNICHNRYMIARLTISEVVAYIYCTMFALFMSRLFEIITRRAFRSIESKFNFDKELNLQDFDALLNKNNKKSLKHTKWFRNFELGNIAMLNTPYNLVQTDNKRELIYDSDGKAIETTAIKLWNNKTLKNIS